MKITNKYVFFWKEKPFCNFTRCRIKYEWPDSKDGEAIYFSSSEQMFMWFKAIYFGDFVIADKILQTDDPETARRLGREVKNYDDEVWNTERVYWMLQAVSAKFMQNKNLRKQLCDPKYDNLTFVEASPYDKIWGIGFNENIAEDNQEIWGKNNLGTILNHVRAICKEHKDILDND